MREADQAGSYEEAELLPLSGLQHLVFCERQCALIHLEHGWRENVLTAEGRLLHERVDSGEYESRGNIRIVRGLPIRSLRLGLTGRVDVVEFHRVDSTEDGTTLSGLLGRWRPFPVEYKRGKAKWIDCDRVQLCAQAVCLEEMIGTPVPAGALFYGRVRRREEVTFDRHLRATTEEIALRFHEIMSSGRTPLAYRQPKCKSCSLLGLCLPPTKRRRRSVGRYLAEALEEPSE